MVEDLMTVGEKVRVAHRFVAAYEARVMQAFGVVADQLADDGFAVFGWKSLYNGMPPLSRHGEWMRRWFWDYLPLHAVQGWWTRGDERAPGVVHVLVEHVIDSAFEKWRHEKRQGVPDPLEFEKLGVADTYWRARWLRNNSDQMISKELWDLWWPDIFERICKGTPAESKIRYVNPSDRSRTTSR
jgi:hypothetical protein